MGGGGCRKRAEDEDDFDEECDEDDDDEKATGDEEGESAVAQIVKRGKGKTTKKKPGRKPRWCLKALDDFVDIVVNNNLYKTRLIFTNTKNQSNGVIYEKILRELKERASVRGETFVFNVSQLRTKFKKCQSL